MPQMLRYVMTERPGERAAAGNAGLVPRLVTLLAAGDPDVVEAALGVANLYAQPPEQVQYLRKVCACTGAIYAACIAGVRMPQILPQYLLCRSI